MAATFKSSRVGYSDTIYAACIALASVWGAHLYWYLRMMHLANPGYALALAVAAVALALAGAEWLYPLLPVLGLTALLARAGGLHGEAGTRVAIDVIGGLALSAALGHLREIRASTRIRWGGGALRWAASLLVATVVLVGVPLAVEEATTKSMEAVLSSISRLPYTLREFYTILATTRLGLGVLSAVVLALVLRVSYWLSSPLLEAATANPSSAREELMETLRSEAEVAYSAPPEAARYILMAASTALSLAFVPLIGALASLVEEALTQFIGGYSKPTALLLSIAVYSLVWALLRKGIRVIAPRSLREEARLPDRRSYLSSREPLARAALIVLAKRLLLGAALSVLVALAVQAVILLATGASLGRAIAASLEGLRTALSGSTYADRAFAGAEAYAESYSNYLSSYVKSLDALMATLIKLFWGR
ncbi:MAG: hypothetical protein GSR80_000515 [Desulfurococcales archaeon]|nr:hypothetical protein [Desulfurococcales archaeon]